MFKSMRSRLLLSAATVAAALVGSARLVSATCPSSCQGSQCFYTSTCQVDRCVTDSGCIGSAHLGTYISTSYDYGWCNDGPLPGYACKGGERASVYQFCVCNP
jgi:hypothetical protein